ncbi:MAG TPA: D-glycero-beta-D-manno-heptose 1-phosphate adenylyltransferase [Acidobacteriota bacterium]|jgi:rfaE bifunctional protein nucleotidyltransferase chain/domain|nr:D-glycero-beta-D-manno-heptose 1-phosphate adenylyltransferase [Acidobacteriota bacterium]
MGDSSDDDADIAAALVRHRKRGERIVFTNGCFDLLHPGHLEGLRQARALGDRLVVGVNSDESVRQLKGADRPVVPLAERLELLRAIRWVDYVVAFDSDTPADLIAGLRPDVYAKGADWQDRPMPEADAARAAGVEVVFLDLVAGYSTTDIIERIRAVPLTPAE